MSIRYELSEFYDNTIDRTEDFGYQVADQTRRALCGLWSNLPGAIIPNPGDSFRRGALSALCQDFPPPSDPVVPFQGGQCPNVNYSFVVQARQNGQVVNNAAVSGLGPIGLRVVQTDAASPVNPNARNRQAFATFQGGATEISAGSGNQETSFSIVNVVRTDGQPDNCGNPDPQFEGPDEIDEGDTVYEGDTIVEGDTNIPVTIDLSPTFEDEVCIGQFVFCADVEGNRVTLDLGGVTLNLPGTGGGDSGGGGGGGDSETITNIDNRTTIIQQQQEDCCAAIQLAISQFRNRMTELLNEAELRDACIVGLIRFAAPKYPKFEEPISERANGFSGFNGVVRFVQPLRGDSCFLIVNIEPTEAFRGRLYALRNESADVEGGFGHVEVSLFDGGVRPAAEAGIRVLSATRTLITFPYISSGNQIRLSLKGGLNYSVVDPGFRWRPLELPQCDEIVDPTL